ncbi:hypothetical protein [Pandoraea pulmonicola]|uniref:Uncharacterized protein conserved in bacteria n=1 Tax=Pandoraea pulmonicola TaxID=93221 RepID=A0AAJ4ZAZ3_PANPU|nr:hypothetical protein [Pandoraea pulmonicola]AJC21294.1 hypothetical protein RO07_13795 [Pandoraea pulmonicola]SUA90002.1 Uncharacterized protein conserved in bacteria [Pandoraea pulmonicola]
MILNHQREIVRDAFGLWISGLFSAVCGWNPGASFLEKKEYFLSLLETLLREGKVMFIAPGADCYVSPANPTPKLTVEDPEARWNAPISEIMDYVRGRWPEKASDEKDIELTYYFYELPGLIWVGEDGRLVVS